MPKRSLAALTLVGLFALSPRAEAGPMNLYRGVRDFVQHNGRVDRDEKLNFFEHRAYLRSGSLPARVAPDKVLARKLGRAELALARLRMSTASQGGHAGIVIDEMFSGALANLNSVSRLVADVRDYARQKGLSESRTAEIAREALDRSRTTLAGQSGFLGLGSHAVLVESARQSARDLTKIAAASR